MSAEEALRSDARANQDKVLEAAARLFASEGSDASLRSIAREAEVGIATLYRRFPSRELLVEAVYRNESERLGAAVAQLLAEHPPYAALLEWMRQFLAYLATKSGMAETLRVLLTTDEGLRLQTRSMLIDACDTLLRAAEDSQEIRTGIDATDVVMALGGFAFIAQEQTQPELEERLLHLLVLGLRA